MRYPVGKIHEDEFVTYKVIFACQKIGVLQAELYYYYCNETSIMNSNWTPKKLIALQALHEQIEFFKEKKYRKAYENAVVNYISNVGHQIRKMQKSEYDTTDLQREIIKNARREFNRSLKLLKKFMSEAPTGYSYCHPLLYKVHYHMMRIAR